jgi:hypothetical protein
MVPSGRVPAGIPSLDGQIDAAGEGKAVVDDDDLLMMRGVQRMMPIQLQGDSGMLLPVRTEQERLGVTRCVYQSTAPHQYANMKLGPPLDEPVEKFTERAAIAIVRA